ncbi:MAG TPA: EAL domain-containing protein [Paucimonas sp.]|nr:EAL domain-containing protein [Paucimonas sp.]
MTTCDKCLSTGAADGGAIGDSAQLAEQDLHTHAEILANMAEGVIVTDERGTIVFVNAAMQRMYGYAARELVGMHVSVLKAAAEDEAKAIAREVMAALRTQGRWSGEFLARRKSGETFIASAKISRVEAAGKVYLVAVQQDVTGLKKAEEALHLWERAIAATTNGVVIMAVEEKDYAIVHVNPAFERITGYSAAEVVGRSPIFLLAGDLDQPALQEIGKALRERREGRAVLRNYRKDGELFWNDLSVAPVANGDDQPKYFVGIQNDITELKRYEQELEYQATHDGLTGLPNRILLRDRLEQALTRARRNQESVAVLFIDLDHFKIINDSIGHDAGDALLCQVAERLQAIFREEDTVARHGGDEFVVVMERVTGEEDVIDAANRVLQAMSASIIVGEHEFYAACSIGIGLHPKDGVEAAELMKNADTAMYQAKAAGRNTFRFYAADMNVRAHVRFELEAAMRHAIVRKEFVLHYQPQVELGSGRLIGFEALVRWQHPTLGLLEPGRFIGLAEDTGMIVQIGEWVLREACRQLKQWQEQTQEDYFVAVNLSARQFGDGNLLQLVDSALAESKLAAQCLELEITESLLMENPETGADTLRELRSRGVKLSIDDFGTGYSSLGYLKRFPLDKLKIDSSFVRDITTDPDDAAIATAIIAMAHRLKLKVIAEGVETEGQLGYLRAHDCDEVQGYFFSRPLPADACTQLLRTTTAYRLPATGSGEEPTLLLVDDEENILNALRRSLRREGYRILSAGSAREGFEILAQQRVDVIVSDQRMPEMNGTEFLSRVRELHPGTVRMVLSGYTDLESVTDAINRGAIYKFLTKPWEDDALRTHVAEAFKWCRLNRASGGGAQKA